MPGGDAPAGGRTARRARLYDRIVFALAVLALLAGIALTVFTLLSRRR
jgi:hypothetical protein